MSLLDHAIWWQVFPLSALGAPIRERTPDDAGHRLKNLDPWLDYLVELGCNGLLLGPVFESVSHGYDTLDHFAIDRRLGDDEDFDHLIAECRARGINVMLDGVFNHVADTHPRAGELAKLDSSGAPEKWEGHGGLAKLDHSNPATADLVTEAMLYWLRRGIAGWRLDVAYEVPPEFWATVTARVRKEFPNALFLGEMIHGDFAAFVHDSTLDTVTQYNLWKAIWSSIDSANFWELDWALTGHTEFCETFTPQTFISNHDVDRIATAVGPEGAVLAATILMTVPGMPSIYYGDEQGFTGRKLEGFSADDELRPPLPPAPENLALVGKDLFHIYQGLISIRRQHEWMARGKIVVVEKTNETIDYTVTNPDNSGDFVRVALALEPCRSVLITGPGERTLFEWRGVVPAGE
ncbi:MAG: alpha-amylase family protein [Ancrocorticia sp.]|uniref:alpha-amylase family protein n=1 Tax=Ancrocorticia sp. TaxID=2593684 RepID=UPI003F8FF7F5